MILVNALKALCELTQSQRLLMTADFVSNVVLLEL
jgi:hypothetical protein